MTVANDRQSYSNLNLRQEIDGHEQQDNSIIRLNRLNIQTIEIYNKHIMNGRAFSPGNSNSEKNLIFNNIRYVKPIIFMNDDQKQTRNLYYDSNPYFLNNNPLNQRSKGIYNANRNSNLSRDVSQTSSQRSGKVVRANGLRLAEKPRIVKATVPQRQPSMSQGRNTEQTRRLFDRNIELEQENRILKEQNNRLRQNVRIINEMHKKQIDALNHKFQMLLSKTEKLQIELQQDNIQWKKKMEESSQIKPNNYSQFSSNSNINTISVSNTPKPYYNSNSVLHNNQQRK